MKKIHWIAMIIVFSIVTFQMMASKGLTQKDLPPVGTLALFSNLPRPVPGFDHERHESAFVEGGCARCHHVEGDGGSLVYEEGDEAACIDCHSETTMDNLMAIREASHQQCTGCHRAMKIERIATGPTTCGECHRK